MTSKMGLLTLFLLIVSADALLFPGFLKGDIRPKNPEAIEGSSLELNCTVKDVSICHSREIYFERGSRNGPVAIPLEYQSILNETSVTITVPNVTMDYQYSWFCKCKKDNPILIDIQYLKVGRLPVAVKEEDIHCVAYNKEWMECRWYPESQDTGKYYPTSYILTWRLHPLLVWSECVRNTSSSCQWLKDDKGGDAFNPDLDTYYISITASNKLDYKSTLKTLVTDHIVKPNAVLKLETRVLSSTSVNISWQNPLQLVAPSLTYKINYTRQDADKPVVAAMLETSETWAVLVGLRPFTRYTVEVFAKPLVEGFWSDGKTDRFQTSEDVPSGPPRTVPGAFETSRIGHVIHWQPPSEKEWNGRIDYYRIQWASDNRKREINMEEVPAGKYYQNMGMLDRGASYRVVVNARTTAGYNNSLVLPPIRIVQAAKRPSTPRNFTAVKDGDRVELRWEPQLSRTRVYWCPGSYHDGKCAMNKPLKWSGLLAVGVSSYTHVVGGSTEADKDTAHLYYVSTEEEGEGPGEGEKSSGMLRSRCTYLADGVPTEAPSIEVLPQERALTVSWENLNEMCSRARGLVYQYNVLICPLRNGNCQDNGLVKRSLPGDRLDHTEEDLDPNVEYGVRLEAVTLAGTATTPLTEMVRKTPLQAKLGGGKVAGIVIAIVVILAIIISLAYGCWRLKKRIDEPLVTEDIAKPSMIKVPSYMNGDYDIITDRFPESDAESMDQEDPDGIQREILGVTASLRQLSHDSGRGTLSDSNSSPPREGVALPPPMEGEEPNGIVRNPDVGTPFCTTGSAEEEEPYNGWCSFEGSNSPNSGIPDSSGANSVKEPPDDNKFPVVFEDTQVVSPTKSKLGENYHNNSYSKFSVLPHIELNTNNNSGAPAENSGTSSVDYADFSLDFSVPKTPVEHPSVGVVDDEGASTFRGSVGGAESPRSVHPESPPELGSKSTKSDLIAPPSADPPSPSVRIPPPGGQPLNQKSAIAEVCNSDQSDDEDPYVVATILSRGQHKRENWGSTGELSMEERSPSSSLLKEEEKELSV